MLKRKEQTVESRRRSCTGSPARVGPSQSTGRGDYRRGWLRSMKDACFAGKRKPSSRPREVESYNGRGERGKRDMTKAAEAEVLSIGGREVKVSNPGKIYFAAAGITKLEVVRYYVLVGEGALRGIFDRPIVL